MAERVASLSMYEIAETAVATNAWWDGIARSFIAAGVTNVPVALTRPGMGSDFWLRPDLLFSQTCGYPMITMLSGQVSLLATPGYDAPGCAGADYASLVVVGNEAPWKDFQDLRGKTCAVNGVESWSGHHALRLLIAREGGQGGPFCRAIESGEHAASVAAVADGRVDFAAVDCVTYATLSRHKPAVVAGTRVLCRTPAMPGLPLIAGQAASVGDIEAMRAGLAVAAADPALADARKSLGVTGMHFLKDSDYGRLAAALLESKAAGVGSLL